MPYTENQACPMSRKRVTFEVVIEDFEVTELEGTMEADQEEGVAILASPVCPRGEITQSS